MVLSEERLRTVALLAAVDLSNETKGQIRPMDVYPRIYAFIARQFPNPPAQEEGLEPPE